MLDTTGASSRFYPSFQFYFYILFLKIWEKADFDFLDTGKFYYVFWWTILKCRGRCYQQLVTDYFSWCNVELPIVLSQISRKKCFRTSSVFKWWTEPYNSILKGRIDSFLAKWNCFIFLYFPPLNIEKSRKMYLNITINSETSMQSIIIVNRFKFILLVRVRIFLFELFYADS